MIRINKDEDEKELRNAWIRLEDENLYKAHILNLFDNEVRGISKKYIGIEEFDIVLFFTLGVTVASIIMNNPNYFYMVLIGIGFLVLVLLDRIEFKEKKLTKLYEDYLVTNDWKLIVDRPNTLLKDKNLKLDCDYILEINSFAFILTRAQFDKLSTLRNMDNIPLILDLREAVEFGNRFKEGKERYDNIEAYEYFNKGRYDLGWWDLGMIVVNCLDFFFASLTLITIGLAIWHMFDENVGTELDWLIAIVFILMTIGYNIAITYTVDVSWSRGKNVLIALVISSIYAYTVRKIIQDSED